MCVPSTAFCIVRILLCFLTNIKNAFIHRINIIITQSLKEFAENDTYISHI